MLHPAPPTPQVHLVYRQPLPLRGFDEEVRRGAGGWAPALSSAAWPAFAAMDRGLLPPFARSPAAPRPKRLSHHNAPARPPAPPTGPPVCCRAVCAERAAPAPDDHPGAAGAAAGRAAAVQGREAQRRGGAAACGRGVGLGPLLGAGTVCSRQQQQVWQGSRRHSACALRLPPYPLFSIATPPALAPSTQASEEETFEIECDAVLAATGALAPSPCCLSACLPAPPPLRRARLPHHVVAHTLPHLRPPPPYGQAAGPTCRTWGWRSWG